MPSDLHSHTTFSDASVEIKYLPVLAKDKKLTYLAISDHDTFKAYDYCKKQKIQDGVRLIPAVELTAQDKKRKRPVHVLCYFPKKTKQLKDFFETMAQRRNDVISKSLNMLEKEYPCFFQDEINEYKKDSGVLYKSHLMNILVKYGYTDVVYGDLFKKLLGKKGKFLVNPEYYDVYYVIEMAKKAGAVVVLAHPSVYNSMALATELVAKNVIDGIEVYHPRNKPQDIEKLLHICNQNNLIITGGSDFHGQNTSKPTQLGACTCQDEQVERIIKLAKERGFNYDI